jgi:hypothetical protein
MKSLSLWINVGECDGLIARARLLLCAVRYCGVIAWIAPTGACNRTASGIVHHLRNDLSRSWPWPL